MKGATSKVTEAENQPALPVKAGIGLEHKHVELRITPETSGSAMLRVGDTIFSKNSYSACSYGVYHPGWKMFIKYQLKQI